MVLPRLLGSVTVAKRLGSFLKDIEPIIRNPEKLLRGRDIGNFPMRPREAVGLFLLCAVISKTSKETWYITTDPQYGDGSLAFKRDSNYYCGFLTEQTVVSEFQSGDITDKIIDAIKDKESLGHEYGKGRNLVVFLDKIGTIDHKRVQNYLSGTDTFQSYWLIGLSSTEKGTYTYFVATLKSEEDPLVAHEVCLAPQFDAWNVSFLRPLS